MTVLASPSGILARAQERANDIIKHAEHQAELIITRARVQAESERGLIRERHRQQLRVEMDAETVRRERRYSK
ncbi:hypothetical protein [Arthrobacter sp. UCD-GKA]|uniref:hypothetical protein n=1 Tax=Arthrobacter sp. UCD-GKA TaxID=1913576 RepID=UPI0011137006|nr:hypothetical protein [Arthrobacter sp. UCD-GKA]